MLRELKRDLAPPKLSLKRLVCSDDRSLERLSAVCPLCLQDACVNDKP